MRLSKRQFAVLESVEQVCRPTDYLDPDSGKETVIPMYVEHLPKFIFSTEGERRRFLENLEARGLIRIHKRHFLYITDAGRAAVTGAAPVAQHPNP